MAKRGARRWARILLGAAFLSASVAAGAAGAERALLLATTTSTYDTGLLDHLHALFEERSGVAVKAIAVGTGEALRMGSRGDVDVVVVHAPEREREYLERGSYASRRRIMHNHFLLLGPPDDPAGVRGHADVADALRAVAATESPFVSRGDDSGTHIRERRFWKEAGVAPAGAWYLEAGQGMGATLVIASEKDAYTLSDRGSWLAFRARLRLVPCVTGTGNGALLNVYSALPVDPERFPGVNAAGARAYVEFLVSPEAQEAIRRFGVDRFGEPLFVPSAGAAGAG